MTGADSTVGNGRPRWNLAVADAGWFTTAHLFREVPPERAATLLLRCMDYRVAWAKGLRPFTWNRPIEATGPERWEQSFVLPTGWMKTYPWLGMRPIARAIRRWLAGRPGQGDGTTLVITYPHYLHLARMLRPDRLIYLNVDDYRLYWPKAARQVERLEQAAVRAADLTVCTAHARAEELRQSLPDRRDRIRHLPHGAPSASLPNAPQDRPGPAPDDIATLPRPWLGYVGTLEDRVDWATLDAVAVTQPHASIILVGQVGSDGDSPWQVDRRRCLARPNVHAVGWRDQTLIDRYNRSFDVGLIPYRIDHPFNRACCPTKIMDYMAAGRPVVSTDLPECRLYTHVFDVVPPAGFVDAITRRLASGPDDGRASARLDLARRESCRAVATRLLDWIA